jgi:hypothetical protein
LIDVACIKQITLSPWLPGGLVDSVVATLRDASGRCDLSIYRTTLLDNVKWQKLARPPERVAARVVT